MSAPTEEEKRKPFLYRYFVKIPEAGKFEFLDSGWMDEVTKGRLRGELSDKQYAERIESIKRFERQLTDNGYLVLKLFFQIKVFPAPFVIGRELSGWRFRQGVAVGAEIRVGVAAERQE